MKKILLVITGLGVGGAERIVVNLADELVKRNFQVKIVYFFGEALLLPKKSDVEVISIGINNKKDIIKAYIDLRKLIKKIKPDVIHSHLFHANLITRLVRITTKFPRLISSSHNTDTGGILRKLSYRLTDRLVDVSTNVSQEAVDAFIKNGIVKKDRMLKVVNGIDTNHFKFNNNIRKEIRHEFVKNQDKLIIAVGRLEKQKDYPNLINAISILKKNRTDFKVIIVGGGSLKDELLSLTKNLNLTNYISFLGIRYDIPNLLSASDVFVLSSSWEGFGLVVAEAMACERVVVATDCGGVKEVIGDNGFLVKPRETALLAKAIDKALDLIDVERSSIGISGRKRIIEQFSLEANVNSYLKLY